jgi:hypothetical protein
MQLRVGQLPQEHVLSPGAETKGAGREEGREQEGRQAAVTSTAPPLFEEPNLWCRSQLQGAVHTPEV